MTADLASVFQPATPAMIIGHSVSDGVPPLGLSEPFALLGGDRLGPAGIPFLVGHEWQPAFLHSVRTACDDLVAAGRPWFRMAPALLAGPAGAGRSHAARSLARAAGVLHIFLNLSDPVIGASISGSTDMSEALWVSPIVTAMAATRCANPVVSVIGADVNADAAVALASMVDPVLGRAWMEERIGTVVDLGEVTWLIQADAPERLPAPLADKLATIPIQSVPLHERSEIMVSLLAEVLADLDISPADPAVRWQDIVKRCQSSRSAGGDEPRFRNLRPGWWAGSWHSPRDTYDQLRTAVLEAQYDAAAARLGGAGDSH
ncbi:P-loop NTPase family protein [Sphingomonas radiodurans]|uniref:hypothetical protein n=1 Tax=Sphingomonas radiodurans TaxID=2890321 RepID=UPI001E5968BF|nr:hypothetical protein [Sphingomonas radiodurans]WBH15821.1 hypothetical protein LLW23_13540 [Sphingomonas radiodurans]